MLNPYTTVVIDGLGYIGPGAGFAFLGSFLILLAALALAFGSVLAFPFRVVFGTIRRIRKGVRGGVKRVVVLGLDGMDPGFARRMMAEGKLPNLAGLAEEGHFSELQTTCPPISPVAWSSFATGTNPGKHNVFDFLNRDLRTYLPEMSSCRIQTAKRTGFLGRSKGEVTLLRKSRPFWHVLGDHGVFSTILRVPITFPPERFRGLLLSAMCAPDLRGTQGEFTVYETGDGQSDKAMTGGRRIAVQVEDGMVRSELPGPPTEDGNLATPLTIRLNGDGDSACLRIGRERIRLRKDVYSDWVRVSFGRGMRKAHGICRFLLLSGPPQFRLYVTPIHIDPDRPAMPISHPLFYAIHLAKLHGPFATMGLAEDTWALDEGVIDDDAFLRQVYDIHREREAMFLEGLRRTRKGVLCCVFDLTDRVQHEFFRYEDKEHPARSKDQPEPEQSPMEASYEACDRLVGRTLEAIDKDTVFIVLSDHGFASFRRCVNLNAWLRSEGYLAATGDEGDGEYLRNVDWARTKAYCFGLSGLYLNLKGRESSGIVEDGVERQQVKAELIDKLKKLVDPKTGEQPIREVYDAQAVYSGPYRDNGPDLVIGYKRGYRVSWETAVGRNDGDVFSDNDKPWSGDHCMDHTVVPGLIFCNRRVNLDNGRKPHITDLGPTVLKLCGVPVPAYMDGRPFDMETQSGDKT